jgi:hypothetical protein
MKTNILKVTPPFDQMAVDAIAGCHAKAMGHEEKWKLHNNCK